MIEKTTRIDIYLVWGYEMDKKRFGAKLKLIRKSRQLTQEEVVANIDYAISVAAYSKIERGDSLPKLDTLDLITAGLGLPFDYLYKDYFPLIADKKDLFDLLNTALLHNNYVLGRRIMNRIYRLTKNEKNSEVAIVAQVFKHMIVKLTGGNSIHTKMVNYIVQRLEKLPKDQFLSLCRQIWEISYTNKKFDLFIDIIKRAILNLNYEKEKVFEIWFWYATAHYYTKQYIEAYEACHNAIKLKDFAPNVDRLAVTLNLCGTICLQRKQYEEARFRFEELMELLNHDFNNIRVVRACCNIGRSYYLDEGYDDAKKYWDLVLKNTNKNDSDRLFVLNDYAYIEMQYGTFNKGLKLFNETKKLLAKTKKENINFDYSVEEALCLRNEALVLKSTENYVAAKNKFFESLDILINSGQKNEMVEVVYLIMDLIGRNGITLTEEKLQKLNQIRKALT
jgi:transcriptional regulator with XRE-family HTH domain